MNQIASQATNMAALLADQASRGGHGGGGSGMPNWCSGTHIFGWLPLQMRISVGLEQLAGLKGMNTPMFQLSNQIFNCGSGFGLANSEFMRKLMELLKAGMGKEDYAADLQDAMAALAQCSFNENDQTNLRALMSLRGPVMAQMVGFDNDHGHSM